MSPVIMLAVGGAVLAGVIAAVVRHQKQRTEGVRQLAGRLGWGFQESVQFSGIPGLDRFELFSQGRARKLRNLVTSPAGDPRIVVFDYTYTTGGGKSRRIHSQTVCYATADHLSLPSFSLRPENFFHRVAGAFGYQDIDLERHPDFSRAFVLRGEDVAGIRDAFTDDVVAFFDSQPGTCAAGIGHEVLLWRPRRLLAPDEWESLVGEALDLVSRFSRRPPPTLPP